MATMVKTYSQGPVTWPTQICVPVPCRTYWIDVVEDPHIGAMPYRIISTKEVGFYSSVSASQSMDDAAIDFSKHRPILGCDSRGNRFSGEIIWRLGNDTSQAGKNYQWTSYTAEYNVINLDPTVMMGMSNWSTPKDQGIRLNYLHVKTTIVYQPDNVSVANRDVAAGIYVMTTLECPQGSATYIAQHRAESINYFLPK